MKIISIAIVVIISVWYSGYGSELTGDILYQMPGGQTIEEELIARGFAHFMKHSTIVACLQGKVIDSNELMQTIQDCKIEYARWFAFILDPEPNQQADTFEVLISANGFSWIPVEVFEPGPSSNWEPAQFRVGDFLTSPQTIWLRFTVTENGGDSYIRGAVDAQALGSDRR